MVISDSEITQEIKSGDIYIAFTSKENPVAYLIDNYLKLGNKLILNDSDRGDSIALDKIKLEKKDIELTKSKVKSINKNLIDISEHLMKLDHLIEEIDFNGNTVIIDLGGFGNESIGLLICFLREILVRSVDSLVLLVQRDMRRVKFDEFQIFRFDENEYDDIIEEYFRFERLSELR